jgi:TRAP-type mannitol/chloroaromatic compound transport system permease small subunit
MVPTGFLLLSLQGISELIKRIAILKGLIPDLADKPPPAPLIAPANGVDGPGAAR